MARISTGDEKWVFKFCCLNKESFVQVLLRRRAETKKPVNRTKVNSMLTFLWLGRCSALLVLQSGYRLVFFFFFSFEAMLKRWGMWADNFWISYDDDAPLHPDRFFFSFFRFIVSQIKVATLWKRIEVGGKFKKNVTRELHDRLDQSLAHTCCFICCIWQFWEIYQQTNL